MAFDRIFGALALFFLLLACAGKKKEQQNTQLDLANKTLKRLMYQLGN
ncbi:MAG TPA: hypothetical protein VIK10_09105 [Prolixibacteraceae bacterium]